MFSQYYTPEKGWHDARIGPYQPFVMDPAAMVFHYGQEIFEGLKAYRRPDGKINLFRPWENCARFNRSAQRMAMAIVDEEDHFEAIAELVSVVHEAVPAGPESSLYIRPTMIANDVGLGRPRQQELPALHYRGPDRALLRDRLQPGGGLRLPRESACGCGRHRRGEDRRQLRGQPLRGRASARARVPAGVAGSMRWSTATWRRSVR